LYRYRDRHASGDAREEFDRFWLDGSNKSTANEGSHDGHVAIFTAVSTPPLGGTILRVALLRGTIVSPGAEGIGDMQQVTSLLRSAPSRIGRQLKLIVAIAAASLPSAGV
jgi:hypothetical protein